jgi:cytochrome c-type biogenesis protein CcmH/NrfF
MTPNAKTPGRQDATLHVNRRDLLTIGATSLLGVVASWRLGVAQSPDSLPAGKVWDPARAGRPVRPITALDTDPGIQAIEKRLRCSCGCGLDIYTCRTTDFNCTYSPELHRQVVALAEQGKTPQEIIDNFVAQYGIEGLMAPPKRGFNLLAYFVPSIVVLIAGGVLFVALRRWTRAAATATAAAAPPNLDASPAELERLRRELERLPG